MSITKKHKVVLIFEIDSSGIKKESASELLKQLMKVIVPNDMTGDFDYEALGVYGVEANDSFGNEEKENLQEEEEA